MGTDVPLQNEPVLDISTLAPERPTVRIRTEEHPDGELWELRVEHELSVEQLAILQQLGKSVDALEIDDEDLTPEQGRLLEQHVEELLDIAFAKGGGWRQIGIEAVQDKVAIAQAFIVACFGVSLAELEAAAQARMKKRPKSKARPTGVK